VDADQLFEQQLRGHLHQALDAATGPHPIWADAPAAALVATDDRRPVARDRRPSRMLVVLAAGLAATLVGLAVLAGGVLRSAPVPPPENGVRLPVSMPSPTVSQSESAVVPPSAVEPSPSPCVTQWSHRGSYPKGGLQDGSFLWRLDGDGGQLAMTFLNSIDTVKEISIVPVSAPPLRDAAGRTVHVDGSAFFKLVIEGLTRATQMTRDDMKAEEQRHGPTTTVQHPIAEARRLNKPRQVLGTPTQNEIWIIGVDYPACLSVRTLRDTSLYEVPQPGDNIILVSFERQSPSTPAASSPTR
jgi:hypothetical protein